MDLFIIGQGKLGLRSYNIASQARTLWANERLWEPERAWVSQSKPKWVSVSKSDSDSVIQSDPERARERLAQKYVKIRIVAKISFTHCEPKNDKFA